MVTSGGQAELGRALGGYVNVVTKSGTNALHGDRLRLHPRRPLQRAERAVGHDAADEPAAVRRRASAVRSCATGRSTSRTSSSAGSIRPGSSRSRRRTSAIINARLAAVGYPGPPVTTGVYPESGAQHQRARQGRSPGQRPRSVQRPLQPVRRHVRQLARRRRAERAERVGRPRQHRSDGRVQQHADAVVAARCNETRAQFAYGDLKAPPTDPDRPGGQHRRRGVVRHAVGQPDAAREHDVPGRRQPVAPGGRARAARRRRLPVQRRHHHVSAVDRGAATRSRRWRTSWPASTTTPASRRRSAIRSSRRRNPNVGVYAQDEWKVGAGADAERSACATTCSSSRRSTPTRTTSRRASGSPGRRSRRARTVVRGSAGLFFDRVPLRALANALLSAGNTTDLANLRQIERQPVAGAGRRAGVSRTSSPAPVPSVTLVEPHDDGPDICRTRTRGRRASRSSSSSARGRTVSVGYQYLRGEQPAHVGQPERADAASRRAPTTAAGRTPTYANNSQYSSAGESNYHGLHVSFVQRPARLGPATASPTRCRSR